MLVGAEHADVVGLLVGQDVEVLVDRVGGALEPPPPEPLSAPGPHHVVVEERRQAPGLRDVPIQAVALVLGQHGDAPVTAVDQVRQREIDEAKRAAERDRGLRAVSRQRGEAMALSARQDHSEYVGGRYMT
jgi:PAS domain-containing protein